MPVRPLPVQDWLWPGENWARFCTCSIIMGAGVEGLRVVWVKEFGSKVVEPQKQPFWVN